MPTSYLVTTKTAHCAKVSKARYATVDEALQSAKGLLEDGAPSVWIISSNGDLILPADQVRLRLRETNTDRRTLMV